MSATAQSAAATPVERFIDPAVLARIDSLSLIARTVVGGFISGLHRSPMLGLSIDFAEHRAYMPGDDLRRIDWRVFARTDRLYVKETEADTNTDFCLLLDLSRSMDYASIGVRKIDYARYLAASLAYLSNRQRDRVGLLTFADVLNDIVPPAAKHFETVLHTLDRLDSRGSSAFIRPLQQANEVLRRRGIIALISDLYEQPERIASALSELRIRGHDLIVFHVLDPAELDLPEQDATGFIDLETAEQLPVILTDMRDQYRDLITQHSAELQRRLGEQRIDYVLVNTSQPLDYALFRYLSERARLSRVR